MTSDSEKKNQAPLRREVGDDKICRVIFDNPGSSANIFSAEALDALAIELSWIKGNTSLKGVVFETAKDTIFVAGADIKTLSKGTEAELMAFLKRGQDVFDKIEALKIPSVAAIHGAALGGGLEVALACDWRVCSDAKATRVGLPETQLGILPAWGGSTRLPKLIGLKEALGVILKGGTLNPSAAKYKGIVDGVAPRARLTELARQFVAKGKRPQESHTKTNNPISAAVIRRKAKAMTLEKTRGHYPAQIAAIDVACDALKVSHEESLANERDAAMELAKGSTSRNLMRIFFLTETAKRLRASPKKKRAKGSHDFRPIERVCVVGAGVMGSGIAHWLSTRGVPVLLQDINGEAVARGMKTMSKLREGMLKRRLISKAEAAKCADRITTATTPVPLHRYDMVIEAAVENLGIKKKIFSDLSQRTRPDAILATNTSALPITELAAHEGIENPSRVLGLHFFNPVHMMKLVEVVAAPETSPAALDSALAFTQRIAKLPVLVNDSPGFVVNRILMPYMIEAGELFSRGVDPELIDEAMLDFGMPMGPIRLLDEVGIDVGKHVSMTMAEAFPDRFAVPEILDQLSEEGHLGRKSGAGFYLYKGKGEDLEVNSAAVAARGESSSDLSELDKEAIAERLSLLMVNESYRCLEEGVSPDADTIDFAMIMGAGFAPFRGGPMTYAESLGLEKVVSALTKIDATDPGDRFEPCKLLNQQKGS